MSTGKARKIEQGTEALPLMKVPAGQMTPQIQQQAHAAQAEYMQGRPDSGHRFDHMRPGGRGSHLDHFLQSHGGQSPATGVTSPNLSGSGSWGGGGNLPSWFTSARNSSRDFMKESWTGQRAHAVGMLGMKQAHDMAKHDDTFGLEEDKFVAELQKWKTGREDVQWQRDRDEADILVSTALNALGRGNEAAQQRIDGIMKNPEEKKHMMGLLEQAMKAVDKGTSAQDAIATVGPLLAYMQGATGVGKGADIDPLEELKDTEAIFDVMNASGRVDPDRSNQVLDAIRKKKMDEHKDWRSRQHADTPPGSTRQYDAQGRQVGGFGFSGDAWSWGQGQGRDTASMSREQWMETPQGQATLPDWQRSMQKWWRGENRPEGSARPFEALRPPRSR